MERWFERLQRVQDICSFVNLSCTFGLNKLKKSANFACEREIIQEEFRIVREILNYFSPRLREKFARVLKYLLPAFRVLSRASSLDKFNETFRLNYYVCR